MSKVEKIAPEQGMYFSDRCQLCHDFGEKIEPYLCPQCVTKIKELGYRKPPDRPELIHEIREILRVVNGIKNFGMGTAYNEYVDKILALFPDKPPEGESPILDSNPYFPIAARQAYEDGKRDQRKADIKWMKGV